VARSFGFEPHVAMLSYSNFGTSQDEQTLRIREALRILAEHEPDLIADGEMQADTAVVPGLIDRTSRSAGSRPRGQRADLPDSTRPTSPTSCCTAWAAPSSSAHPHGDVATGAAAAAAVDDRDIVNATAVAVVEGALWLRGPLR